MKSFKDYIAEARRNPDQNPYRSLTDNLEPYKDDPDIFISYIAHLGSSTTTHGIKVGVNPSSKFATPIGVYTYPLKSVWKEYLKKELGILKVPFAGKRPYVAVLRKIGHGIDDLENYNNLQADVVKIKEYYTNKWSGMFKLELGSTSSSSLNIKSVDVKLITSILVDKWIETAMKYAKFHYNDGGKLWNITRYFSILESQNYVKKNTIVYLTLVDDIVGIASNVFSGRISESYVYKKYNKSITVPIVGFKNNNTKVDLNEVDYKFQGSNVVIWNHIFRKILGYEYAIDRSGFGIIHEAEPKQAVFFSNKGYNVVDVFDNVTKKEVRFINDINFIWSKNNWDGSGVWKKGTWKGATWLRGTWEDGIWQDGVWNSGTWLDGDWKGGTWHEGVWKGGRWEDGTWYDGDWWNGTWLDGKWGRGTWYDGEWRDGMWYAGVWKDGRWLDGTWKGGKWFNGTWENGAWEDGTWLGGTWKNGWWKGGVWEKGVWKGGTWKGGYDKNYKYHKSGDSPDKWNK